MHKLSSEGYRGKGDQDQACAFTGSLVLEAEHLVAHGSSRGSYTGCSQSHALYPEWYLEWCHPVWLPDIWRWAWRKRYWAGVRRKMCPWFWEIVRILN